MKRIIKVYDCHEGEEWVAACSPKSALRFYLSETGIDFKFDMDSEMPVEVCDSEMERLRYVEDEAGAEGPTVSFKVHLSDLIKAKTKFPCWFAVADY